MTGTHPYEKPEATASDLPADVSERPPDQVVAAAKASYSRRTGGELAVLVVDTLVDQSDSPADHRLQFAHPSLTVDVHVSAGETGSSLTGRMHPVSPERAEIEFDTDGMRRQVEVNEGGFSFDQLPHGIVRLHLHTSGAPTIHTDWFRI
jgi:hypothetical protein